MKHATTNDEAVALLAEMARTLAWRRGMVSGYITLHVGAGNPDYFYKLCYKHDGYGPSGRVEDSPPAIVANGRTFIDVVNEVAAKVL